MNKWRFVLIMLIVCFFTVSLSDFRVQKENPMSLDANNGLKPGNIKIDRDYGKMPAQSSSQPTRGWVVKLEFVGARKNVKPECLEQSGTKVSYFRGKPEQWHAGLQAASKIIYRELWPGIDLVYYGTVNKMKYEFIVHPGADPAQIKLAYRGADSVKENSQGQLEVKTGTGGFSDDMPVAWQDIAGKRESVALKYAVESGKDTQITPDVTYGFSIGQYDRNQPLILDPAVIVYCGYIGGSGDDCSYNIAVDGSGCAYITGHTNSDQTTFPMVGPNLTYNGGERDAFVAKIKADGTGLLYCGYIGGSGIDKGYTIVVDGSGCAYITGLTNSDQTTFPVIVGPVLTFNGGSYGYETFVAKVNAAGTSLDYCGYIGGSYYDDGNAIAVDASGCAYVTGWVDAETTLPVTIGPDLTYNGLNDAFVAKVKADGTGLVYCGYIGGSGGDAGYGIAVDASGCAYVTGVTTSTESTFPVTGGPDLKYNGNTDAYVAKVRADGTGLVYCGYIGGSDRDFSKGIAVDGSGCAYVTGYTKSTETTFPVIGGPNLTCNGGFDDAFVAKVNASGTTLVYCGYIGGAGADEAYGIAVDTLGCAYITGYTSSTETTFPVAVGPDLTFNGSNDAFVAKVNTDGTGLGYCGYIGSAGFEISMGIAVNGSRCAYISGYTNSTEASFPVTVGPDLTYNGSFDAFVAKISSDTGYTVNFAAGKGGSLTGITTQTIEYGSNCTEVEAVPNDGYYFVNWTGMSGFETTTDNPLTVTNVTADMNITANFSNSPLGWVPVEGLQYNMIVYGKAYNGNNPASVGDWLGAFGPGGISDCRAIAAVQTNGNYYITIGSNETSGETNTFKLCPIPVGPSIDSSETITFVNNGVYDGLPLHFGPREQAFNLVNGWNWISFNTLPTDTSFNSVFGTPSVIEQIKSQTQAAIYTGGSWTGDLTDMSGIANGVMYKVKTNQAYAFNVTGMAIPFNTPISLVTEWNWAAYLPTLSQPVQDAVIKPNPSLKSVQSCSAI
ncbi:MAG: SBBP repeat-containing protein [Candidatus Aminicenantes bacterium]|nr:SBBP repeat-containing protein [Candidatus Aminicenantes bacterium]